MYLQEERGTIKSQTVGSNGSFINNGWHYLDRIKPIMLAEEQDESEPNVLA